MQLAAWLAAEGLTLAQFATTVGTTEGTVSRWRSGDRYPSPPMMRRIVAATGGQVRADDFYDKAPTGEAAE